MATDNTSQSESAHSNSNPSAVRAVKRFSLRLLIMWGVPAVIIIAALAFAKHQIDTRPTAVRQRPPQQARLVQVETVKAVDHPTVVSAMGPVVPARQITLTPEVTGQVVHISPLVIPGGAIEEGQVLIRIDARDYEAIVKQRESDVARAELNLKLEEGNQQVALQEYDLLEEIVQDQDRALVLRQPHLEEARAALEAARAALAKAKLDVARCTVKAPFNAIIQSKHVDVGARVAAGSPLLEIMGTDEYWIEAKLFVDQLPWITIPNGDGRQTGSPAKIYDAAWDAQTYREGTVLRLLGQLEAQGRLAQVLIAVKDPLSLASSDLPPVLVDSYVRVEIQGRMLDDVFAVKRDYLHDGDFIWVMNDKDRMEIRPVEAAFRDKETVYLSGGLSDGDRIVVTDISAPVDGMLLRVADMDKDETMQSKTGPAEPETQP